MESVVKFFGGGITVLVLAAFFTGDLRRSHIHVKEERDSYSRLYQAEKQKEEQKAEELNVCGTALEESRGQYEECMSDNKELNKLLTAAQFRNGVLRTKNTNLKQDSIRQDQVVRELTQKLQDSLLLMGQLQAEINSLKSGIVSIRDSNCNEQVKQELQYLQLEQEYKEAMAKSTDDKRKRRGLHLSKIHLPSAVQKGTFGIVALIFGVGCGKVIRNRLFPAAIFHGRKKNISPGPRRRWLPWLKRKF